MTSNNWKKIWNKREEYSLSKGIDESKIIDKLYLVSMYRDVFKKCRN